VDALTAELFGALQTPASVPAAIQARLGAGADRALARLVMDGVLEIDLGARFGCGADAHGVLFEAPPPDHDLTTATARLSMLALRHAAATPADSVDLLASRLYFYNRRPATAAWLQRLPTVAATAQFLGLAPGSAAHERLERPWKSARAAQDGDDWAQWLPRRRPERSRRATTFTYKLFVSPDERAAPEALQAVIDVLAALGAPPFKYGCGAYSLLRPDKIVAYFRSADEKDEAARALLSALAGVPAHGVPFSADVGGDGLVSWGIDPPSTLQPLEWQERGSWRTLVSGRLARALIIARHARAASVPAVTFALDRIALEGVDVATWAPLEM
jgi:hypothetical protein